MTQKQNQTNENNTQNTIELSLKKEKVKLKKEKIILFEKTQVSFGQWLFCFCVF